MSHINHQATISLAKLNKRVNIALGRLIINFPCKSLPEIIIRTKHVQIIYIYIFFFVTMAILCDILWPLMIHIQIPCPIFYLALLFIDRWIQRKKTNSSANCWKKYICIYILERISLRDSIPGFCWIYRYASLSVYISHYTPHSNIAFSVFAPTLFLSLSPHAIRTNSLLRDKALIVTVLRNMIKNIRIRGI